MTGPKESESQRFTRQSLETVLNLASAPAQSLEFYCQVLSDDGAVRGRRRRKARKVATPDRRCPRHATRACSFRQRA